MISPRPLAFIHLSDIHFKRGTSGTGYDLDEDIRNEITNDIIRLKEIVGAFDGILVTGDIAFAGKKEEYDEAEKWLAQICELIECEPEEVWLVAGNHDVDRSLETGLVKNTRQSLRDVADASVEEKFKELVHDDAEGGKCVFKPLTAYCEFAAKYKCPSAPQKPQWAWDFALNDGSILRLVGFNSAILSHAIDDDGANRLTLNQQQLNFLKNETGVEYITLCHHPMDWVRNKDILSQKINARARIQLYGHKHAHVCNVINNQTMYLVSGATHPDRGEDGWSPRYNALSVMVNTDSEGNRQLHVKVYPRVWHGAGQEFTPDHQHCENGQEFKSVVFDLTNWQPETPHEEPVPENPQSKKSVDIEENQESSLDIKKLTYDYLTFSFPKQMKIANKLELLEEGDAGLEKSELFKKIVTRAKDRNLLHRLEDEIESLKGES